jgi:hypothetical protein
MSTARAYGALPVGPPDDHAASHRQSLSDSLCNRDVLHDMHEGKLARGVLTF